ncbi:response regulator transcription factor [Streptomyces sp. NPDC059037]|uniref:response regulator transcription factor n=1 Tax=Streptomyces sp. NPDC059037 TaxID=3346710 RepID=UPI0036CEB33E
MRADADVPPAGRLPGARNGGGGGELTPREREVAALVAQGFSNREVAERLVISKRTAHTHVEHILTKVDVTSRTEIAAALQR